MTRQIRQVAIIKPGETPHLTIPQLVLNGVWDSWQKALREYELSNNYPRRHWVIKGVLYIEPRIAGVNDEDA